MAARLLLYNTHSLKVSLILFDDWKVNKDLLVQNLMAATSGEKNSIFCFHLHFTQRGCERSLWRCEWKTLVTFYWVFELLKLVYCAAGDRWYHIWHSSNLKRCHWAELQLLRPHTENHPGRVRTSNQIQPFHLSSLPSSFSEKPPTCKSCASVSGERGNSAAHKLREEDNKHQSARQTAVRAR